MRRFDPRRWSLATKWSLLLTALALGPLLGVIRYTDQTATAKILEKTVLSLANGANDSAASLDEAMGERIRQAKYLSTLPSIRDYVATPITARGAKIAAMKADLAATQATYPYLESLDVIDAQGVVLYSTSGHGGVYKETDLMKVVSTGQVYVAGLQTEKAKLQPSLVIAAPIGAGAQGGVIRIQSSPAFLAHRVKRDDGRQGAGTLGMLLDDKGKVITRSDEAAVWEVIHRDAPNRLRTQYDQVFYTEQARLESIPWTYVLGIDEQQIANELAEQRTRSLLLTFGVCLVIGGLARLLALRVTRPLVELAEATRALAGGDLTYSVKPTSQMDEMGQLQTAFSEASTQLRRLVARMRLSSHLVAEASEHLHTMTGQAERMSSTITTASEKLSVVSRDLERQVAHFRI